jgi:hypothetical protein
MLQFYQLEDLKKADLAWPMDYLNDSLDCLWPTTIPRLNTHTIGLYPLIIWQSVAITWSQKKEWPHLPEFQEFGQPTQETVFGSWTCAFSCSLLIFNLPPKYDNKLKVAQHATTSALKNQEAAARFLLLPDWTENSINACHNSCTDKKDVCFVLRNIPMKGVCYMPLLYQQIKTPPLPEAIGHAYPSSLEQSSQDGSSWLQKYPWYEERNETYHLRQSGKLEVQATYPFSNRQLKRHCQGWIKSKDIAKDG